MNGLTLRRKLESVGVESFDKDFAHKVGMQWKDFNQALRADDVKSSVLEKIRKELHLQAGFFFADEEETRNILGPIVVNTDPITLKETKYDLNLQLNDGETLKYLAIVSISISEKSGRNIEIYTPETYHIFLRETKPDGGTIYFLFFDDERCAIRYVDDHGTVHEQYIGDYGLRITIQPSGTPGIFKLSLFQNTKKLGESVTATFRDFEDPFRTLWYKYEQEEIECYYEENIAPDSRQTT